MRSASLLSSSVSVLLIQVALWMDAAIQVLVIRAGDRMWPEVVYAIDRTKWSVTIRPAEGTRSIAALHRRGVSDP
ncbi:hypothetical protein BDR07DRAFT_168268 [Suillus spraguei]|nr:hypothetical protein BDR07DRAFT_168268 [Suillus spraguei]